MSFTEGAAHVAVTGGAGYIGSHICEILAARGVQVTVIDDFSTGSRAKASRHSILECDLRATESVALVQEYLSHKPADYVIHMAAHKRADESVAKPGKYYRDNVSMLANILDALTQARVKGVVSSSTAAVYGDVPDLPVPEGAPTLPANPYGGSKLACEHLLAAWSASTAVPSISLRYFNVCGSARPDLRDTTAINLFSILASRFADGLSPHVYGTDYATRDGSAVRDYIHVQDLSEAHVRAMELLGDKTPSSLHNAFNIGTGVGQTVMEVINEFALQTGRELPITFLPRRPGDPASVVADPSRFTSLTTWKAERGLSEMVASSIG